MTDKKTEVRSTEEALKLALEALENAEDQLAKPYSTGARYAITAIREALAEQPAQQQELAEASVEPVAHMNKNGVVRAVPYPWRDKEVLTPLYPHPPANANAGKPWVGLTADEMEGLYQLATYMDETDYIHMLMMAEDKLKEKNGA